MDNTSNNNHPSHYVKNLVTISKFAGERFDLVQAGGGNSSVKLPNGTMLIKASGVSLSEVEHAQGYVAVDNFKLARIFNNTSIRNAKTKKGKEFLAKQFVQQATIPPGRKPSIETPLHTLLDMYVLHTHPIVINAIVCRADWQIILMQLFGYLQSLFITYKTPGIELAYELHEQLTIYQKNFDQKPTIIFLQNHGLIVSSDDWEEVIEQTNLVTKRLEEWLGMDLAMFRHSNHVSMLVNNVCKTHHIAYVSTNSIITKLIKMNKDLLCAKPFCPDTLVYCGYCAIEIDDKNNQSVIAQYFATYQEHPKVIIYKNNLYFIAPNVRKAKDIEDVFKFHLLALHGARQATCPTTINFLQEDEQKYLADWDAEKYRQTL